jgi:hypothetical protein
MADLIHGNPKFAIDGFVDTEGLERCLKERNDDTRYILNIKKGETYEKFAAKLLAVLQREFPSRRFAVSRLGDAGVLVLEMVALER